MSKTRDRAAHFCSAAKPLEQPCSFTRILPETGFGGNAGYDLFRRKAKASFEGVVGFKESPVAETTHRKGDWCAAENLRDLCGRLVMLAFALLDAPFDSM